MEVMLLILGIIIIIIIFTAAVEGPGPLFLS